ncbi:hypothetical protein [Streptomyces sp. NPDC096012]
MRKRVGEVDAGAESLTIAVERLVSPSPSAPSVPLLGRRPPLPTLRNKME